MGFDRYDSAVLDSSVADTLQLTDRSNRVDSMSGLDASNVPDGGRDANVFDASSDRTESLDRTELTDLLSDAFDGVGSADVTNEPTQIDANDSGPVAPSCRLGEVRIAGACTLAFPTTTFAYGYDHTCLINSGIVFCAGSNANGRLGVGLARGANAFYGYDIVQYSFTYLFGAGGSSTCAGFTPYDAGAPSTVCFGRSFGSFGLGNSDDFDTPTVVPVPYGANVWRGNTHVLWRLGNGQLYAGGTNGFGELGLGAGDLLDHNTFVPVPNSDRFATFALTLGGTVAIGSDGTLWGWGSNSAGRLGRGTEDAAPHPEPVQIGTATHWRKVRAGDFHYCAQTDTGEGYCWGDNFIGEATYHVSMASNVLTPLLLVPPAGTQWLDVACGWHFSCGVTTAGTLWCWGDRRMGLFQIGADTDWTGVIGGGSHFCATRSSRLAPLCFGPNDQGQLGFGLGVSTWDPGEMELP